jgi:hypothetical protein
MMNGNLLLNGEVVAERLTCFGTRWLETINQHSLFDNDIYAQGSVDIAEFDIE